MPARTWPEPHTDTRRVARIGLETQAQVHGLDLEEPGIQAFLDNQVEVLAERDAEIRWLRSLLDSSKSNTGET